MYKLFIKSKYKIFFLERLWKKLRLLAIIGYAKNYPEVVNQFVNR